jgi:hypothetical protein
MQKYCDAAFHSVSLKADPAGKTARGPTAKPEPFKMSLESAFQFSVSEWLMVTWTSYRLKSQHTIKHGRRRRVCSESLTCHRLDRNSGQRGDEIRVALEFKDIVSHKSLCDKSAHASFEPERVDCETGGLGRQIVDGRRPP